MSKTRAGFTLIELLVVMALIAIVATMAVMFFPNAATANREANAAQQLQSWLNIAKQRAVRNQRTGGVRLWITTATVNANSFPNVVTECQYIEQPDDFRSGTIATLPQNPPPSNGTPMMPFYKKVYDVLSISGVDLTNGYGTQYDYTKPKPGSPTLPRVAPNAPAMKTFAAGANRYAYDPNQIYWVVQPCPFINTGHNYYPYAPNPLGYGGDYLEVLDNGMMHQIIAVLGYDGTNSYIQVWPPMPTQITTPMSNFRIVRGPRVVGTEMLTLPDSTFIDLNTNGLYNNPLPNLSALTTGIAVAANDNTKGGTGDVEIAIDEAATANAGNASIDILFSPSGQVITPGVATSNMHLWVRCPVEADFNDPTKSAFAGAPGFGEFRGSPTIVSVFVRTGFVGAYPPAQPTAANNNDPYFLVR